MSYQQLMINELKNFPETAKYYKKRLAEIQPEPVRSVLQVVNARTLGEAYETGIKRILKYGHIVQTEKPYYNLRCEIEFLIFKVEDILADRLSSLCPMSEEAVLEKYTPQIIDGSVPSLEELPEKIAKKELHVYMYSQRAQNYFWDAAGRVTDIGLELTKIGPDSKPVVKKARILFDGKTDIEMLENEIVVHMGLGINQEELILKHFTEDFPFSNRGVEILFSVLHDHAITDEIFGEEKRTSIPCLDIRQMFLRRWYDPKKDSIENLFEGPLRLDCYCFYRSRDHLNAWNYNAYANTVQQIIRAKILTDIFQKKKQIEWRGKIFDLQNTEVVPGYYVDLSSSDHIYHTDWKHAAEKVGMDLEEERPDVVRLLKELETLKLTSQ